MNSIQRFLVLGLPSVLVWSFATTASGSFFKKPSGKKDSAKVGEIEGNPMTVPQPTQLSGKEQPADNIERDIGEFKGQRSPIGVLDLDMGAPEMSAQGELELGVRTVPKGSPFERDFKPLLDKKIKSHQIPTP